MSADQDTIPVHPCYGCSTPIPDIPGNAYCDRCIQKQLAAHEQERQAFEDFHHYADAVANCQKDRREVMNG